MLDFLVDVFTISTGVVIALAAAYAGAVQRSRYLREVAPDLRVSQLLAGRVVRPAGETLTFSLWLTLKNVSNNVARNVSMAIEIEPRGGLVALGWHVKGAFNERDEVLPDEQVMIGVHVDLDIPEGREKRSLGGPADRRDDFQVQATVTYATGRELVLALLSPSSKGILRFIRRQSSPFRFDDWEQEDGLEIPQLRKGATFSDLDAEGPEALQRNS